MTYINIKDSPIDVFNKPSVESKLILDSSSSFLYLKAQKICAAILLIVEVINDNGIKDSISHSVFNFMSFISKSINKGHIGSEGFQTLVGGHLMELSSLLRLASIIGYISAKNLFIIEHELTALIDFLQAIQRVGSGPTLDENHFAVSSENVQKKKVRSNADGSPVERGLRVLYHKGHKGHVSFRNVLEESSTIPKSISTALSRVIPEVLTIESRHEKIVDTLRTKSPLSIKDFLLIIPRCSEKTIQRDLVALVEKGILKKEGKIRWSKYSLGDTTVQANV